MLSVWGEVPLDLDESWWNSSYKPPDASYTAQGPQKQPEILKHRLFIFYYN